MTPNDPELTCAVALLRAFHDLLLAQQRSQPEAYPEIRATALSAATLRLEATVEPVSRAACVRICTLDDQGSETMMIRQIDLVAPAGAALQ